MKALDHLKNFEVTNIKSRLNILFRLKGKGGKIFDCNRLGIVNGVKSGKIASNFTYLDDISWMNERDFHGWKLSGPGANSFDYDFPDITKFNKMFTNKEVEILKLLTRGFSSLDIARALTGQ